MVNVELDSSKKMRMKKAHHAEWWASELSLA